MYENLRGRVSRIVSVGVSAVVGAIEGLSPEGVMEEAIREVEAAAREVRAELDKVLSSRHMANKRLVEKDRELRDLGEKIKLAVTGDRDDLAEAGIARQLDIEAQVPILTDSISELNAKEKELNSFIAALDAKKREMTDELATLRKNKSAASGGEAVSAADGAPAAGGGVGHITRKADGAVSTFDRIMARESGLPQSARASVDQEAKLAELNKLSRDNRIKERLAALKAEQNQ